MKTNLRFSMNDLFAGNTIKSKIGTIEFVKITKKDYLELETNKPIEECITVINHDNGEVASGPKTDILKYLNEFPVFR